MSIFVFSSDESCGCLLRGTLCLGVASRTLFLLLRFGGVWVDVENVVSSSGRRVVACVM